MSGRRQSLAIQEDVSPNLIPMIDIMFLLLLFFMLGADMGQRELEEVILPKATAIKEDKEGEGKKLDRLTINIFHRRKEELSCAAYEQRTTCRQDGHWKIGIQGKDFSALDGLEKRLKDEADHARKESGGDGAPGGTSDRRVMIRADAASPYGHVQDVMDRCARVGIYQIECGAARPPEGA